MPSLSIEITRECPLRCPGCYAYGDEHLGGDVTLRQVTDYKGQELVDRFMAHRRRSTSRFTSRSSAASRSCGTASCSRFCRSWRTAASTRQLVTSAVRPIPAELATIPRLQIVVSIDGLQPEHDVRRTPATYDRILKHIDGSPGHGALHGHAPAGAARRLPRGVRAASGPPIHERRQIWVSLYTPQVGEVADEILQPEDRERVVAALMTLRHEYPKLQMPEGLIKVYANPPQSPDECIFAQTTTCISADFERRITPCQFGGTPDCSQCGCIASAGLAAVARASAARGLARRGHLRDVHSRWAG